MTRCAGEAAAPCIPGDRCLTHGLWDALGEQIAWFLDNVTLQDVVSGTAHTRIGRGLEKAAEPSPLPLGLKRGALCTGSDPLRIGNR
jgi:DNA-binding IscR family transcriptional regulator